MVKCFLHSKTEKKMKRTAKAIAAIAVIIFTIIAVFWVSTVYVRDYKLTEAAISVSPDGKYELILQDEQQDEQILLYFDGKKERR